MNGPLLSGDRWTVISRALATMVVVIGAAVVSSWLAGRPPDAAFAADFGVLKANGALAFIALGFALLLLPGELERPGAFRRLAPPAAASVVLLFALFAAGRYLVDPDLRRAEFWRAAAGSFAGLPSFGSVVLLLVSSCAILLLATKRPRNHALGQVLATVVLFVALVLLVAYAFDLRPHRAAPHAITSAHGALAFVFVAAAALLARASASPMSVLLNDLPSSQLARALIIGVVLILPALGWLWLEGEQRGLYGDQFSAALMVVSSTALLGLFIWASASRANESEAHLDRLRRLYAALSRTNQTIARFKDRVELLSSVCRTAVEEGGFRFAWIAWTNPEGTALHPAAEAAAPAGFIEACVRQFDEAPGMRAVVRDRLALQKPVFVNDVESDPLAEPRRVELGRAGVRSVAAIPIVVGGRLVALLIVYSGEPHVFRGEERDLLQEMASDVGLALQHLEHGERHRMAMAALQHSESRLASILTSLNSGIWSVDPRTHATIYVNPAFERIFGHSARDFLADPWLRFRDIHPEDRESVASSFYAALEAAGNASFEYRLRLPNGGTRWIQDRGWVVTEADGARRYDGIATDITERKQSEEEIRRLNATLEKRVAERTAQLENANRELNAFSYSVSHDLRAPLRAIEGFSALLAERIGPRLDAEEHGFLQRIRRGVERMSSLIEGMLQLARLSTQSLHRTQVDVSAMAKELADELQAEEPARRVEWKIAPGLVADADPALLRAALQNLLSNAWKFTGRVERPVIEVGSEMGDEGLVFVVRDNGAGFDMSYSDRLFDTFHRMHGEQEFPGTGIGLATVKRIISRHGGRIGAEAAPGMGATFRFSLGTPPPGGNAA